MITLVPASSGTLALQEVVPDAVPESPVEFTHLILATATLSAAVPLSREALRARLPLGPPTRKP